MKTIDIVGANYFGEWKNTRTACRAIVCREGRLLLSHGRATGLWMLPGGGLEDGESETECCVREVAEETGTMIRLSGCILEIDEYYEDWRHRNLYFEGEVVGAAQMKLTERERFEDMGPGWLPVAEIMDIFSRHADYAKTDEERRGLYLREYTALREWQKRAGE